MQVSRQTRSVRIHFSSSGCSYDSELFDNSLRLNSFLDSLRAEGFRVTGVELTGWSSPEGRTDLNLEYSSKRASAVGTLLVALAPDLLDDPRKMVVNYGGENWEGLRQEVLSCGMDYAADVAAIIEDTPLWVRNEEGVIVGGRKKSLMDLAGGEVWRDMLNNVFPRIRYVEAVFVSASPDQTANENVTPAITPVQPSDNADPVVYEQPSAFQTKPLQEPSSQFSIGTNLLYDAVTVANIHIQVGFARHWAISLLGTFSPWDIKPTLKMRTLLVQPELRYFFAEGFKRHYLGIEGHYGWYNIALPDSRIRYQDTDGQTPLYGAGLTYGYIVPFSDHWGMDFNISAGYAHLCYDSFYNVVNGEKFTTSTREWFGPTGARISIYYAF